MNLDPFVVAVIIVIGILIYLSKNPPNDPLSA